MKRHELLNNRVELLSPAGNKASFYAALQAGADAVYLGGIKFGARANADNFSETELCEAISYAHIFDRKVYLTLNTLVKDDELHQIYDYITPFYKEGLDGVIVQDFGVCEYIKQNFPDLELHASTQMTITGAGGAAILKDYGFTRVVPARELSLFEIEHIKQNVDIEVETFVHGAMCYAYSGQCLFSSMLGGRSGNRGRCAGPCRLPYDVILNEQYLNNQNEQYVLSLKDLCTVNMIPKLIESGIDSFKIEGRMKSPEYVAKVSQIYRTYIDLYYSLKQNGKEDQYSVSEEDLKSLEGLYVRSSLEEGYYEKHNGAALITLNKPSYETDTDKLQAIRDEFVNKTMKKKVKGYLTMKVSRPAVLTVELIHSDKETIVQETVYGDHVSEAKNRPLDEESIRKQLRKTGNTYFEFEELTIEIDNNIFYQLKSLNELRRLALDKLSNKILESHKRSIHV